MVYLVDIMLIGVKIIIYVDLLSVLFFFFKQKTAYEMRISDWSSDVCSSDLLAGRSGCQLVLHVDEVKAGRKQIDRGRRADIRNALLERSRHIELPEIGRASCRERVCQYV